jgi:hypothetical protein
MNNRFLLALSVALPLALVFPDSALAAKGKGKKRPTPAQPATPSPDASPKAQLAPYISRIDGLLSLEHPKGPKVGPFFKEAAGNLAVMKAEFVARKAKAEGAEAAGLTAAIATCDALTAALDKRQKAVGLLKANAAVNDSGDLGRRRKDNFTEGTEGGNLPRAVDAAEQARRERANVREMKERAARNDNALTQGAVNRWNQRSIELRQQITALYARIG